jgi:hypothetical protein
MGCPSEVNIGDNLVFSVCTHDPDTGVLTDANPVPSYRVYEEETDPPILTGNMAKLDDDDTTGFYTESIACTVANGFEQGKTYTVYIEATVDGDEGGICYGFKAKRDPYEILRRLVATIGNSDAADGNIVASWPLTEDPVEQHLATPFLDMSGYGEDMQLLDTDGDAASDPATGLLTLGTTDSYVRCDTHAAIQIDGTFKMGEVDLAVNGGKYAAWPHVARYINTADKLVVVYRTADADVHDYHTSGKTVCQISTDNGATWGGELTVKDGAGEDYRNPAVAVVDNNGADRIVVTYNDYDGANSRAYVTYSDDNGASWDSPLILTSTNTRCRGRIIQLSTGTILIPVHELSADEVFMYGSTDTAVSWSLIGTLDLGSFTSQETTIVELRTGGEFRGRIGAWTRVIHGYIYTESSDYGVTWGTSALDPQFVLTGDASGTAIDIIRHSDGRLIASCTEQKTAQDDITIWVCDDESESPPRFVKRGPILYERSGSSYPSLVELDVNGRGDKIGVAWCLNSSWSNVYWNTFDWPDCTIAETGICTVEMLAKRPDTVSEHGLFAQDGINEGLGARLRANSGNINTWGGTDTLSAAAAVNDTNLHWYVFTWTEEHARIYLDGVLLATGQHAGWTDDNAQWFFGARKTPGDGATEYMNNGQLGRIRIHNRALSEQEIAERYRVLTAQGIWTDADRRLTEHKMRRDPSVAQNRVEMDANSTQLAALVTAVAGVFSQANIVDGKTPAEAFQYIAAFCAGIISGAGTGEETFKGLDKVTDRLKFITDTVGNRTGVTYDP